MIEDTTPKECVVCGKTITIDDFTKEELHAKPFHLRKRCKNCRFYTEHRANPNYHKERYQMLKQRHTTKYDNQYFQLALAVQEESQGTLIPYEKQEELDKKVLQGIAIDKEIRKLRRHYESVIFMLHLEMQIPHYPYHSIYDLNKGVLRVVFRDLINC